MNGLLFGLFVIVIPFEQAELDTLPQEVLEVLAAADNSTAHLTNLYHNVYPAKIVSVINITFDEIKQRIPGISQAEFGRWKELTS